VFQAEISSGGGAGVFLRENFQAIIGLRESFHLFKRIVSRAVGNADDFEVFVSLVQEKGEEAANGDTRIKNWDDNRNQRVHEIIIAYFTGI